MEEKECDQNQKKIFVFKSQQGQHFSNQGRFLNYQQKSFLDEIFIISKILHMDQKSLPNHILMD